MNTDIRSVRKTMEMMLSATYDTTLDLYVSRRRCDETGRLRTTWYDERGEVVPAEMVVYDRIRKRSPSLYKILNATSNAVDVYEYMISSRAEKAISGTRLDD